MGGTKRGVCAEGLVAVRMTAWRQLLLAMAHTHITGASIRAAYE